MKQFLVYFFIMVFMLSCSSSEPVQQPNTQNNQPQTQNPSENKTPEKKENDDELLNLIKKSESAGEGDENKLDNVEYESIDGSDDTKKEDDQTKNEEKKEENIAVKDEENRREYIENKDNSKEKDNTDELLKQIQSLKNQIKDKNSTIDDLSSEKNRLANENMNLKSNEGQNINVTIQDKISDEEYKSKYDEAYQLLNNKSYDVAISIFETLILSNGSNSLADNAQYWIGEAHFAQGKYKQAILDFEKVFTFAKSNKNEDAQFKLGLCYYLLKDFENARIELNRFVSKYPQSRNVTRANSLLSKI